MNRVEIILLERGERSRRLAMNSPLTQGKGELVKYFADFAPWGASDSYPVTAPIIKILDKSDTDVFVEGYVATIAITDGGTSYEVGDVLTITETGSSGDATITVTSVAAGVIDGAELTTFGHTYTAGVKATTGHTADATFTITVTAAPAIVDDTEIEFAFGNVLQFARYRVYIKTTINGFVCEAWVYVDGEL